MRIIKTSVQIRPIFAKPCSDISGRFGFTKSIVTKVEAEFSVESMLDIIAAVDIDDIGIELLDEGWPL